MPASDHLTPAANPTQVPANRRILVIDDNRAIHGDFRKVLGDAPQELSALAELESVLFGQRPVAPAAESFRIDSAYQGSEGMELVARALQEGQPYALAFVDIRMPPGWDGIETALQLWKVDPTLQIVLCTAYSDYSWEQMIGRMSSHQESFLILKKPFDHVEVRQLAAALTRKWDLGRTARATMDEMEETIRARTSTIRAAHERLEREVTHRHRMEAQLRRAQKLEALGRLAAGIAHEINNPLAFVVANIQFVREALDAPSPDLAQEPLDELRAALAESCVGGERIKQIVRDLKAFAQPHDESLAVIDVRPVVDFSLKMAAAEIRRRAQLVTHFDEVPAIWAIGGRLEQVFVNLLINAAHAIPPGAIQNHQIRVTVHAIDDHVAVDISDTGVGIPPANLERIFDPFFTTKPVGVGTGLGLSICHSIVTAFGGELTVESEEGKGTTFRVSLPCASYSAGTDKDATTRPPALRVPEPARILVVDAEPAVAKAIRRVLSGHKVQTADGGVDALALTRERPFDLVLYDVTTTDLSPVDMYQRLLEGGAGLERRLVLTIAGALSPELAAFIDQKGIPCIDKPFDAAEIDLLLRNRT
jgi:two-component system NtrC family sensor kinase